MADKSPDDDRASKFFRTLHMSRHGSIRDSANAQRMSTFTRQRLSRMFDGNGHGGTRHGADAGEPPSARNPPAPPSVTSESQHTDPSTIYSTMGTSESGTLSDHHKTLRFSRETVATLDSRRRTQRKTMAGKELPADDLSTPADMTRETLLNALRTRFHFGEVYTVIQANNLVAVNPWKEMDVYGDAEIDRYGQADLEAADYAQVPHVFELAGRRLSSSYCCKLE